MFEGLRAVEDGDARARLGRYLACLRHWSPKVNLTGAQNEEEAFQNAHPARSSGRKGSSRIP